MRGGGALAVPLLLAGGLNEHYLVLISCLTMLFALPLVRRVFTVEGRELNAVLGDTGKLMLLYSALFALGWVL